MRLERDVESAFQKDGLNDRSLDGGEEEGGRCSSTQRGEKADEFSFLVFSNFSNSLLAFLMLIRVTADSVRRDALKWPLERKTGLVIMLKNIYDWSTTSEQLGNRTETVSTEERHLRIDESDMMTIT